MNVLILDAPERECYARDGRLLISDDVLATAYNACGKLASDCEADAQRMDREGRHALAAALRESAVQYREAERLLQGG